MALHPPNQKVNPLTAYMRQPKIYVRLPSNGSFWPEDAIDIPENNEYPVFSMTAKDEILLKTPDALMNGQGVVDVIQSCLPNIKNAWHTPNIDLDAIMVAIRIATYGEHMELDLKIGEEDLGYKIDLRQILDQIYERTGWDEKIDIGTTLAIYIKPANYLTMTKTAVQNFETQKIISLVSDSALDEEEKIQRFRESFKKLTDVTVDIINSSVYKIESPAGVVDDPEQIKEFLDNCDRDIFDALKNRLNAIREHNTLPPIRVQATPDMLAKGSEPEIEIPLSFDPSTFFA